MSGRLLNNEEQHSFFRDYWLVLFLIALVSSLHYLTPMGGHAGHGAHAGHVMTQSTSFDWWPAFHGIYRRLYYFPIVLAAFRGGARSGLGAAVLVSLIYLPHAFAQEWGLDQWVMADPGMAAEKVLEILLYLAMGLLSGLLVERLNLAHRSLASTAQKLQTTLDEKIAVEQELVRSARLATVGKLSAGLAHEIRNPLASIQGTAEVLADDFPPSNPKHRLLDILLTEAERLNQVLSRFLEFARSKPCELTTVDLVPEVQATISLLANQKETPRLTARLPDQCLVSANSEQVRQILMNLILNAVAMTPGDRPVTITVDQDEHHGRVLVQDQGPGFSPEAVDNFGTPFFSTREGGTGLGLATSLRMAENMNGTLAVVENGTAGAAVMLTLNLDQGF